MISIKHAAFVCAASLSLCSCSSDINGQRRGNLSSAQESAAQGLYNRAIAAEKSTKPGRAIKDFNTIFTKYPLSPLAGDSAYRSGKLQERSGELLDAFDAYDAVVTKYPASPHYSDAINRQEAIAHQAAQGHIKNSFIGIKSRVDVNRTVTLLGKVRDNAPRAASADRAQFTIGELYQSRKKGAAGSAQAISAYRKLTRDFPDSKYAPEAQYRIGLILLTAAKDGNQDSANLDRAKRAFDDVLIRYPNSQRATDAKAQIAKLSSGDTQRSYDVAEFYRKKGQNKSAIFYYKETVSKSASGELRAKAQGWINQLSTQ